MCGEIGHTSNFHKDWTRPPVNSKVKSPFVKKSEASKPTVQKSKSGTVYVTTKSVLSKYGSMVADMKKKFCAICKNSSHNTDNCKKRITHQQKLSRMTARVPSVDSANMTVEDTNVRVGAEDALTVAHPTVGNGGGTITRSVIRNIDGDLVYDQNTILNEYMRYSNYLAEGDFRRYSQDQ